METETEMEMEMEMEMQTHSSLVTLTRSAIIARTSKLQSLNSATVLYKCVPPMIIRVEGVDVTFYTSCCSSI